MVELWSKWKKKLWCWLFYVISAINQEKTIQNVEHFDKTQLRHAETAEKNPLPGTDGMYRESGTWWPNFSMIFVAKEMSLGIS